MARRKALAQATVELTPLIDVVFLLLIFFMISTSFIREARLGIDLPVASGEPGPSGAATVEVAVYRDGRYTVNGRAVAGDSVAALVEAMNEAIAVASDREPVLTLVADGESDHQSVVRALEAARNAGLTRISMVTRQPDGGQPDGGQPGGGQPDGTIQPIDRSIRSGVAHANGGGTRNAH